ncbi:MAG: tryptophan synthase subunit beta, partial [Methanofollis sp.]|nr:tryptophan synthase subunit beta [Methanofollis sp.]
MKKGYFGEFGGQFVPETLMGELGALEAAYERAKNDPAFQAELEGYLSTFAGRETPLTYCRNLSRDLGCRVYLKREDLLHGGA